MADGTLRERLTTALEERTGLTIAPRERLAYLEEADVERGALRRELDSLAWTALNAGSSHPQDMEHLDRMKLVAKARMVWKRDPQAGASVELMNDFVFGRGLARPKANDELVQEIIDDFWDDPDNQETLTDYEAQLELGTDLALQNNLFFLIFDDGEDGRVKLAMLDHDTVIDVVRDKAYRKRVLFYVAEELEDGDVIEEWNYQTDPPTKNVAPRRSLKKVLRFYPHWRNVEAALEDFAKGRREMPDNIPPQHLWGDGKVYHVATNKTGEMVFGHPQFDRLIGWFNAYNRFMDARVDMMEAQSAFFFKSKIKGTPSQLRTKATQALSRRSALGMSRPGADGEPLATPPERGSIQHENENLDFEQFKFDTGAGNAAQDARMLGAQVSAATRFPRTMYGDAGDTNLATATSLELPVLKAVGRVQQIVESVVRRAVDRAIERAVDKERIPTHLTPEERAALQAKKNPERQSGAPPMGPLATAEPSPLTAGQGPTALGEAHEDAVEDEEETERDLGYEFKMPNPLERQMTDFITAIMNIARTFDPNNTNMELSRTLLERAFAEALEFEDAAAAVEKIFPEGYVDPAVAAAQAQAAMPPNSQSPFGEFAPEGAVGADGQRHPSDNAYGAAKTSQTPEQAARRIQQSKLRGRDGNPVELLEAVIGANGMVPYMTAQGPVLIQADKLEEFVVAMRSKERALAEGRAAGEKDISERWDEAVTTALGGT